MKKNLLVATFAAALIALGSMTTSRAQSFTGCASQCDAGQSSCTLSCPPQGFGITDNRTGCLSSCYQANANCRQTCMGLPLSPVPPPTPPPTPSLLPGGAAAPPG
jgi:hypothetical protein